MTLFLISLASMTTVDALLFGESELKCDDRSCLADKGHALSETPSAAATPPTALLEVQHRGILLDAIQHREVIPHIIASAGGVALDKEGKTKKDRLREIMKDHIITMEPVDTGYLVVGFAYSEELLARLQSHGIMCEDVMQIIFHAYLEEQYASVQAQVQGSLPPKDDLMRIMTSKNVMEFIDGQFKDQRYDAIQYILKRRRLFDSAYGVQQTLGFDPGPATQSVVARKVVTYPGDDFMHYFVEKLSK